MDIRRTTWWKKNENNKDSQTGQVTPKKNIFKKVLHGGVRAGVNHSIMWHFLPNLCYSLLVRPQRGHKWNLNLNLTQTFHALSLIKIFLASPGVNPTKLWFLRFFRFFLLSLSVCSIRKYSLYFEMAKFNSKKWKKKWKKMEKTSFYEEKGW